MSRVTPLNLPRCKDEFGQLNARVLGIKKVRQTVMDGWRPGVLAPTEDAKLAAGSAGGNAYSSGSGEGVAVIAVVGGGVGGGPGKGGRGGAGAGLKMTGDQNR